MARTQRGINYTIAHYPESEISPFTVNSFDTVGAEGFARTARDHGLLGPYDGNYELEQILVRELNLDFEYEFDSEAGCFYAYVNELDHAVKLVQAILDIITKELGNGNSEASIEDAKG